MAATGEWRDEVGHSKLTRIGKELRFQILGKSRYLIKKMGS